MENLQNKKESILESALVLINEQGFHGCPVSKVAKNAGVAAGSIYTYFDSKEELIMGVFEYVSEKIKEYVSSKDDESMEYEIRFFNYWKNYTEYFELNPAHHGFYDQFVNSPFHSENSQLKPNGWHEWANQFFQSGIDSGAIKYINPTVLAILVNSNINSVVRIKNNFKNRFAEKNVNLEEISSLIWEGIRNK
ncbi:AcrR family transcriptional regulator [Algoriphagus iocasae]|uniref:AcrR family transcriptional regulator n=1 Tax=Algoriphagus iocasae TaxID=1836499 RepID=A0A841MJ42_9BACT|nr:TetR/AcrR family transcriptional regulator [Algoriphagus iocasae]MBB6325349.1 AcrR family transcriptional regulator [Algoriphagus iocasae]